MINVLEGASGDMNLGAGIAKDVSEEEEVGEDDSLFDVAAAVEVLGNNSAGESLYISC